MKSEKNAAQGQRILSRTLAKELSAEELEQVGGKAINTIGEIDPTLTTDPPISTLVYTDPPGKEDQ